MPKSNSRSENRRDKTLTARSDVPWTPRRKRWGDMTWRDFARIGGGVVFGVLGLAGLVLPILQGILFLFVAAFLLTPYSLFMQRQQARLEARFPGLAARAQALIAWVEARFRRRG